MSSKERLRRFNRQSACAVSTLCLFRGALRCIPAIVLMGMMAVAMNHWMQIPLWGNQVLWIFCVLVSLGFLSSGFFPLKIFSVKEKSKTLSDRLASMDKKASKGLLRKDELVIALQMAVSKDEDGISSELKLEYLDKMAAQFSQYSTRWCFPSWDWKKSFLFFLLTLMACGTLWAFFPTQFPLNSQVLFPFGSANLENYVRVLPGDSEVAWGGEVEIKVSIKVQSLRKPVLYVRTGKEWMPIESQEEIQGTQIYKFSDLVEPLVYRVKWKKDWGRKYTITPVKPIQITRFNVVIRQPDYVGGTLIRQVSPELRGLPGSQVQIEAESSAPLLKAKILFSDGAEVVIDNIKGTKLKAEFTLFKSGTYGFFLKPDEGQVFESRTQYPIHVIEDASPTVTLLSPEEDLVAGEREIIPLTFQAEDDFGIKEAVLVWEGRSGDRKKKLIRKFGDSTENVLDTFDWDLGFYRFRPGELLRYQIQVVDGNTVTGPGQASTDWRYIEIASFDKSHEALESVLNEWRDEILKLLAEVNTLQSDFGKEETKLSEKVSEMNKAAERSEQLQKALEKIVSLMEEDPMADYGVWLEHKAMSDNMKAMNQGAMKRAQGAVQTQNRKEAQSEMGEVAAELERMYSLSEELSKSQRARDVMTGGEDLADLGEDLINQLEEAAEQEGKLTSEQMDQLNRLMSEAQKIMSEMAQSLQKFPDELPEDFVNQEALEDIEMDKTQDLLSQMNEAIQKGDFQSAMKMARQFLEMAKKMQEQLSEAHESYLQENSAADLEQAISKEAKKLEEIANQQRELLMETQKLEAKRLEEVLKEQEKRLESLAGKQKQLVKAMEDLLKQAVNPPKAKTILQSQLNPMKDIGRQIEAKRLTNGLSLLKTAIDQLGVAGVEVEKSTGSVSHTNEIKTIKEGESEILAELKKRVSPSQIFSKKEMEKFKGLKERQSALAQKTQGLKSDLQKLSQKTASLGVPLTQSLSKAKSSMGKASEALGESESQPALRSEENALRHLLDSQGELSAAQGAMGEMAGQQQPGGQGQGGGQPKVMMRGNQKKGSRGTKVGKVRLPTAEDYRPPKEFREELLESLKEKYPEIYEDIVHKYFKRLSD